jgi:hypothetical protein
MGRKVPPFLFSLSDLPPAYRNRLCRLIGTACSDEPHRFFAPLRAAHLAGGLVLAAWHCKRRCLAGWLAGAAGWLVPFSLAWNVTCYVDIQPDSY